MYISGVPGFCCWIGVLCNSCFLLPVFGVAAVFSVAGKAGFCVAAVFLGRECKQTTPDA